jgi:uncharacterized protein (DUF58 family)
MITGGSTGNSQAAGEGSPVRVTQAELIRLAAPARLLSLEAMRARSRRGGQYLSHFKGRGMEFAEARPYQEGDDPRNIDWRVTARSGKPFTKLFREERERPVLLWLDLRAAMHFATRGVFKSVLVSRAAALLAWVAMVHGDRVGGFLFAEDFHRELRPRLGRRAVLRFLHEISSAPVWERRAFDPGLSAEAAESAMGGLRRVAHTGSLVVLFSDFRDFGAGARRCLADIGRHNDVIVFFVHDPMEEALPPPGRYRLQDARGEATLETDDRRLRERYAADYRRRYEEMTTLFDRYRMRWVSADTRDDPVDLLSRVLTQRPR